MTSHLSLLWSPGTFLLQRPHPFLLCVVGICVVSWKPCVHSTFHKQLLSTSLDTTHFARCRGYKDNWDTLPALKTLTVSAWPSAITPGPFSAIRHLVSVSFLSLPGCVPTAYARLPFSASHQLELSVYKSLLQWIWGRNLAFVFNSPSSSTMPATW